MRAISLDKQIHIYSFDTSAFYTDEEKELSTAIDGLCYEKNRLKLEKNILEGVTRGTFTPEKAEKRYRSLYKVKAEEPVELGGADRLQEIDVRIREINRAVRDKKGELTERLRLFDGVRALRSEYVIDRNVISVFESMLTRTLGMETGKLYDDFMVVRTYYFDVVQSMIANGFTWNGERYVCFTASAGQIRTKKTVFIKERVWREHQQTLMCGLSVERINERGGININKYLAYLALCNSATDPWEDFDISKSIVVEDMETDVNGVVDFIDDKTYAVERKRMAIPITHTDGCGMVLPQRCRKNTMVRLPWVKGLLAVFPFDKFIREADAADPSVNHGKIRDIYGVEHDILADGIEVIFTKSQFKMWKYYDSWAEYIRLYRQYGCSAGKCNEEEDYLPDAKLNYQMLQTLTDMTPDEIRQFAEKSVDKINRVAADRQTMLEVFGATSQYDGKNAFQECLQLYPELLSDPYTKEILRQIKKNLVKEAKSAKLDLAAKYMFLIPDLYAYCQWLFLGDEHPKGLLEDGEVSCWLYRSVGKLDCLRSPHLYREHAVRQNVVNAATRKWFSPNAIYTSCHDLISRILQFDCDGDKSLVCADSLLVSVAERNMRDIVPLYYEMKKAGSVIVTPQEIFHGLRAAWTGGNIGVISNDISKIWNSDDPDVELVKILCMENNYVIDYAKTLYKPERPADLDARLKSITSSKVPHFFIHAKNKSVGRVQKLNDSVVNRLETIVPNRRMSFTAKNVGAFRYQYMLSDMRARVRTDPAVIELYDQIEKEYRFAVSFYDNESNYAYIRDTVTERFNATGYTRGAVCDMLVRHLFCEKQSKRKNIFWMCFGDIVLENLRRNLPNGSTQCVRCGERFVPNAPQQKLCLNCSTYHRKGKKTVLCADCGSSFEIDARNMTKVRCDKCQKDYRRAWDRERKRRAAA